MLVNGSVCLSDKDVLERILPTIVNKESFDEQVRLDYKIEDWTFHRQKNKLEVDGVILLSYKSKLFQYSNLNPCHEKIQLTRHNAVSWLDASAILNSLGITISENVIKISLSNDGLIVLFEKIEQQVLCETSYDNFPFGNTSCPLIWKNTIFDNKYLTFDIESQEPLNYRTPSHAASLYLKDVQNLTWESDQVQLTFIFSQNVQEILVHFFLPSFLFLIPPWLTLLLGPMAITRCYNEKPEKQGTVVGWLLFHSI
ncbi:unnamed protein product [Caenorhabditis sp. 36 PRJEB53466]|nr:unnamed protein product [Caenorhabditis sp. 36 PRJEB53466]